MCVYIACKVSSGLEAYKCFLALTICTDDFECIFMRVPATRLELHLLAPKLSPLMSNTRRKMPRQAAARRFHAALPRGSSMLCASVAARCAVQPPCQQCCYQAVNPIHDPRSSRAQHAWKDSFATSAAEKDKSAHYKS